MANIRNAGRPCRTITLNFNRVDDTVNEVLSLCSNEDTREIILSFCNEVLLAFLLTFSEDFLDSEVKSLDKISLSLSGIFEVINFYNQKHKLSRQLTQY